MEKHCTNCGATLHGPFCAQCGQAERNRRGPFWKVLSEFTEDVLTFDSRFYRSIVSLLAKPGQLTQAFMSGKRIAILPPVRMYLVMSLLFFVVFDIPTVDVADQNVYLGSTLIGQEAPNPAFTNFSMFNFGGRDSKLGTWFDSLFADKIPALQASLPQVTIDRIFNKLENVLPNALILFVPVFALLLKALYASQRVLYFDHFVFALHFQTWLFCFSLLTYGLFHLSPWFAVLVIAIPIYLARAQRIIFLQSYWLIVPKTLFIVISYIALMAVATLLSLLAAVALV